MKVTNSAGKLALIFLHSPLTALLALFLLALGYFSLELTPREENPQMVVSGGAVIVALPGATSFEVESIIVKPLERKIKEILGVDNIYGIAKDNVGMVNVQFNIGENKEKSNLKLYDKIMQSMDMLPKGAMNPIIKTLDIDIDIPIISIAFYKKGRVVTIQDEIALQEIVVDIQHKINSIEDVALTGTKGGKKRQYNVLVDLDKLSGFHLSMGQLHHAIESIAKNVPDIDSYTKENRLVVFGIKNAIESERDLENIIVAKYMGSPIYLKDIATIEDSYDIQNSKSSEIILLKESGSNAKSQVTLTVSKLKGTNAVVIANRVLEKLEELKPMLEKEKIGYIITRNDGKRADAAVNELVYHLIVSIAIIALLLIYVLGFKESLIVTFTVPAILAITLFVDYLTGQTINRITLFALLLSLGLLVDAAIIVIENIHRHLHAKGANERTMDEIVVEATDEIGNPTNIATLAIIFTMIPMAFVGQMMGEFMKPIPANVPVSLIASLFVAYIFTPYLARRLLKPPYKRAK